MHKILTGPLNLEMVTVAIANLPQNWQGLRLVQLSDFHYDGLRLSKQLLAEAIAKTNELQPDLILLTGDYVTDNPAPIHDLVKQLKHLRSRFGIYAVLGNHDLYYPHSKAEVTAALQSIDIRVLWNQIVYPLGPELALVGLADFWSREFNPASVMSQLDAVLPRIVLSHNPDSAELLQQWRVDLQLSGHTHGGQLVIPGVGSLQGWVYDKIRPIIPQWLRQWIPYMRDSCYQVVRHWEWSQGLHQIGNNQLYVNRGLGTYLPGRLFCPPEVTAITLEVAPIPE